jgi:lipopolysaccharide biosynthesis glycosyltransferase
MKVAFTTVLDDKYFVGFLITLNSMLDVCPDFNHDIIILEWGELSEEYKQIIKTLYSNVQFKMVEGHLYQDHVYDETWRKWTYNCNYRFDIFTFTEYDRVVFFDSDMIFEIDPNEILKYDVDFGACIGSPVQIEGLEGFDAGLMSIGKKYLNEETRSELLNIANNVLPPESPNMNTTKWSSDEPILNAYFLRRMTWLPQKFNMLISKVNEVTINEKNNYQYVGHNKPWYGNVLEHQVGDFVIYNLLEVFKNDKIKVRLTLKKLISKFKKQVMSLSSKGININDFPSYIQPIGYKNMLNN